MGGPAIRLLLRDLEGFASVIRSIIKGPDPRLYQVSEQFDFDKWGHALQDLEDTWLDLAGSKPFGLSAPQIGHMTRAFIVKGELMLNPQMLEPSPVMITAPENCLSYPWLKLVKVPRHHHGRIVYMDHQGGVISKGVSGFYFRIFQHELDHLNGITIESHRWRK